MRYALLVGINSYVEKPLKGCVRDVQEIKKYLEEFTAVVHIDMFTATGVEDSTTYQLIEDHKAWPTYDNVSCALKSIMSTAKDGDSICIYYSGHGVRIGPSEMNKHAGDVALALVAGENGEQINYMKGSELAYFARKMTLKGSFVTVVLDCCFSGGVSRSEGVRSLEYDVAVDLASPSPHKEALEYGLSGRDITMLPNWIVNPDNYGVLTACGPHEIAQEIEFNDHKRHGALSYFLLRVLDTRDSLVRAPNAIYTQLFSRFKKEFPRQNPILYGMQDLSFFIPSLSGNYSPGISLTKGFGTKLCLQAGLAHGFGNGDIFTIFSPSRDTKGSDTDLKSIVTAQITNVKNLYSEIEIIDGALDTRATRRGWIARPKILLSLRKYSLNITVPPAEQEAWVLALKQRPSLNFFFSDAKFGSSSFRIISSGNENFGIWDGIHKEWLRQSNGSPSKSSSKTVLNAIEQLIWFQHVKSITNLRPKARFINTFSVNIMDRSGRAFDTSQMIEVRHQDMITMEVNNTGSMPLYLYVYLLGPFWEIENVTRGTYETIPACDLQLAFPGIIRRKLAATIPQSLLQEGQEQCEDIIKIFLTSQPSTFTFLERPKIGSGSRGSTSSVSVESSDNMENDQDWAALTFVTRTTLHRPKPPPE